MKNRDGRISILMVVTVRFAANGITTFVMNYASHLDASRFRVDFAVQNPAPASVLETLHSRGGEAYVLPRRSRHPIRYMRALKKLLTDNRYDVVHAHGNSGTLAMELLVARECGVPLRIPHSHNTTCNYPIVNRLLRPCMLRCSNQRLACGQAAGEWLFPGQSFHVMHNAIDTSRFRFSREARMECRKALGISEDAFVACHVGSWNTQKNHVFLLDIFEKLLLLRPDARLLLLGDGPKKQEIEALIQRKGLQNAVIRTGSVPDASTYLSASDCFLLPSLFEGLPFTLIEAQCSGLPCFASDVITKEAVMTPQVTMLPLTDSGEAWAKRILSAQAGDREALSEAAADAIRRARYDIRQNAEQLMTFYEENLHALHRLCIVTHKMTGGGCERVIAQLCNRFDQAGIAVTLVSECCVESFYPLRDGVSRQFLLDQSTMGAREVPRAYRNLRRYLRKERPDLVLAMPEKVNVWTVLFLLGTGIPVVVSERNDPRRHPENRLKRLLRRLVYPFANGFIFQTQDAAAYFSKNIRRRGIVLENPLECDRLPEVHRGERERIVVSAGRLHTQKNFPLLIEAFRIFYRIHTDYRLVIYGEGEEREALEKMAAQLPDGVVTLPGQSRQIPEDIQRCAMFVLSSDYEGMPNALIEAMAMGLPCIATDCPAGGPRALIQSGESGLLIPVGDAEGLADAMGRIADDLAFAGRLGEQAQQIRARMDAETVCTEWRRYLDRIANQ